MQYNIQQFESLLKSRLTEYRFNHSLAVRDEAVRLAKKYGANEEKALVAGLLHDIMKDEPSDGQLKYIIDNGIILDDVSKSSAKLWHAIAGAAYLQYELHIEDEDILNAVRYHTTARANMSLLEKVIYLADYTSVDRQYNGVEDMRAAVEISMEQAMHTSLLFSINDLSGRDLAIHPNTIAAWNQLVMNMQKS